MGRSGEQFVRAGVPDENVHIAGICTMERDDLFPSYRMEGDCVGRFVAAIGRIGDW